MIDYDEFGLFHENAEEFGIPYSGPPAVRRTEVEVGPGRSLSALLWGDAEPEIVFLHGGAQNAHTWDTVALALGRPIVAVDLPGHGHSGATRAGSRDVVGLADDVAGAVRQLAPQAKGVVGMSLGGLTSIALSAAHPDLVRRLVLVDVTPGVNQKKASAITAFVNGPKTFPSFEDILARTIEHNPTRTESSLRRGILHNAVQQPDGSWVWRYRRFDESSHTGDDQPEGSRPDFGRLWEAVSTLAVPLLLVRGMREQSVVDDDDEAELLRRQPAAQVAHVDAGHSVQGDAPVELARLIGEFIP